MTRIKGRFDMSRMKEISFSKGEQEELLQKITQKLSGENVDNILVFGSRNITYLSCGLVFPYLDQRVIHPVAYFYSLETGKRVLFCTYELADIPKQLDWDGEVVTYSLNEKTPELSLAKAAASYLQGEIAIDEKYTTKKQLSALTSATKNTNFIGIDKTLEELKIIKTEAEVRLLEIAGRMGDRGFISALNHTEGAALDALSYPLWEYAERFRVHAGEFGGSGVGNISVLKGTAARELFGPCPPRAVFDDGEFVRLEYSMYNHGYWITGSRTVYVGTPDEEAMKAYQENQKLKNAALEAIEIGKTASDIYDAVVNKSKSLDIPFWQDIEMGHGIGTSEREGPFFAPYDKTILEEGMVFCLGVYTYGPSHELICDRDVYHLTKNGPELLTWYKTYDQLYAMFGTSARHG
jgi:Xaa-Pro aminopeptidase